MICYNCGCQLSEKDFCTSCGVDVAIYKRILQMSNRFYNEGLEKANVRDLSGAINCLRQSLKFNKNNIEARNLLGLVYFETGEVVAALSEWVISKNLRPDKNIADDYINMVQTNVTKLDNIKQACKKYNQALVYCRQDSKDLAVIQLKKVLALNPKFIRAHHLLALLYMNMEEWEKARRELVKCQVIDASNTTTLRYLKEVDKMLTPDDGAKNKKKKNTARESVEYRSGNETIIQPMNVKEQKSSSAMVNLLVGLAIGVAVACFLILPARIQSAKTAMTEQLRVVSEQSDSKTATINDLESRLNALQAERDSLNEEVQAYLGGEGSMETMDELLLASELYMQGPGEDGEVAQMQGIAEHLKNITGQTDVASTSAAFQSVYQLIYDDVCPKLAQAYYKEGYDAYRNGQYAEAIEQLNQAWEYDQTNVDALYYLAGSYRKNGDTDQAKKLYSQLVELFPDSERTSKANQALQELDS